MHPGKDPYYVHYYRVNFDGTGLTPLTDADGTHTVTFSPDRRVLRRRMVARGSAAAVGAQAHERSDRW